MGNHDSRAQTRLCRRDHPLHDLGFQSLHPDLADARRGRNKPVFNLGVWAYVQSFAQSKYGMGSAIAVVLTAVLMLITIVYVRTLFKEEEF